VNGGYILIITIDEEQDKAIFDLNCTQGAPYSRVALVYMETKLSEIIDNEVDLSFDEDGWGNSGKLKLIFSGDSIFFSISDVTYNYDDMAVWGLSDTTGKLISNPDALSSLDYTPEEWNELFPPETEAETGPTYDTDTTSGVLAQLGLTEQEFRDSCIPLQYIEDKYYSSPTKVKIGETNYEFFDKGKTLLDMRTYSVDFEDQKYKIASNVSYKSIVEGMPIYDCTLDYYIDYYTKGSIPIVLFDIRDDTRYPLISEGDGIVYYCIFIGCFTYDDGEDYLAFDLISLEQIS